MIVPGTLVSTALVGFMLTAEAENATTDAAAEAHAAAKACLQRSGPACMVVVTADEGEVLVEPVEGAARVASLPAGDQLVTPDESSPRKQSPFIRVAFLGEGASRMVGWIRRRDVALGWRLHRVEGCWPVAEVRWEEGAPPDASGVADTRVRVAMNVQGDATIRVEGEPVEGMGGSAKVYYGDGVFVLAQERKGKVVSMEATIFVLDRETRRVKTHVGVVHGRVPQRPFKLRGADQLPGCSRIPTVNTAAPFIRGREGSPTRPRNARQRAPR